MSERRSAGHPPVQRRSVHRYLVLGLVLTATRPLGVSTEEGLKAADVFARHWTAMGGRQRLDRITTVVFKGALQERSQTIPQEIHLKAPGLIHWRIGPPDGRAVRMGKNAKGVCWRRSPAGILELQSEKDHLLSQLVYGLAPFGQLRLAEQVAGAVCEEEQRDGRAFVSVRDPSGSPPVLRFDARSGLLTQIGEIAFDDYREVEGLKLPFKIRLGPDTAITVTEAAFNRPMEDAEFEIPEGALAGSGPEAGPNNDPLRGNFHSDTRWAAGLPPGFDPARLLEEGKNPGLGIRALHEAGIDGRGVGIAIIDQPLLKDHQEYADRLVRYENADTGGAPPQVHGPAVASIAVGCTCGVAPKASLYYFAVPTWDWSETPPWAGLLTRIIDLNRALNGPDRIRVVSVSLGAFSERSNFEIWQTAVSRAEQEGILVVTCDPTFLRIGTLKRQEGKPPDNPAHFDRGRYYHPNPVIWVPAANRTLASPRGRDVYTYDRTGGMSWTVPYLAGLAALACQVQPAIQPRQIVDAWISTAVKTDAGPVINPAGFIEAIRKLRPDDNVRSP